MRGTEPKCSGLRARIGSVAILMATLNEAQQLAAKIMQVDKRGALADVLQEACEYMGSRYFALSHHVDFLVAPDMGVRLHNYPAEWAHWFDSRSLGLFDPVHRASQRTAAGFIWHDIGRFTSVVPADLEIFSRAEGFGIGDGLTIPAHVPGEAHGSCSFAWDYGKVAAPEALPFAQMIGSFAFEAARRLSSPAVRDKPRLTDRQRECVLWVARGKTDWEISRILGVRHVTVIEHLRNARQRYDAGTRVSLTIQALFDGALSFGDIAKR